MRKLIVSALCAAGCGDSASEAPPDAAGADATIVDSVVTCEPITFGADLAQAVMNQGPCAERVNSSSCQLILGAVPRTGTITKVRVKTSTGTTGPMRLVAARSVYKSEYVSPGNQVYWNLVSVWSSVEYGPEFVPGEDAVTEVPTSISVRWDPMSYVTPADTAVRGTISLSVLASDVEVPGGYAPSGTEIIPMMSVDLECP